MFSMRFFKIAFLAVVLALAGGTANAGILVTIDKASQSMTVSVDGKKRHTWKVSTGTTGYTTPGGTFTPFRLEPDHFSTEWDNAPMPHSIFFTTRGHAIHGSYATQKLGRMASRGCVRLAPQNAAILYSLVEKKGLGNTRIVITGADSPVVGAAAPIARGLKTAAPKVKRQFGEWLRPANRRH